MNENLRKKLSDNQPGLNPELFDHAVKILINQYDFLSLLNIDLNKNYSTDSDEYIYLIHLLNAVIENIKEIEKNNDQSSISQLTELYQLNHTKFNKDLNSLIDKLFTDKINNEFISLSPPLFFKDYIYYLNPILEKNNDKFTQLINTIEKDFFHYFQLNAFEHQPEKKHLSPLKSTWQELACKDLSKLKALKPLHIPILDKSYCVIDNVTLGVTEKIALISLDTLFKKLEEIKQHIASISHSNDYSMFSQKFCTFETEAIIKLPKHGMTTELQHEFIALQIAKQLGFNTTSLYLVDYNNSPALFIPFDNIELLTAYTHGIEYYSYLPPYKKYLDQSSFKTLGEGYIAADFFENFGKYFAYLYLCNDPDAFGADNQNKGIINEKWLYIFDQVFSLRQSFYISNTLDVKASFFAKQIRHFMGRNYSLINDTHFFEKLLSIKLLFDAKKDIDEWLENLIQTYQIALMKDAKNLSKEQRYIITLFKSDSTLIKNIITDRIHGIFDNFPTFNQEKITQEIFEDNYELLAVCLYFIKQLNPVKLYLDQGIPFYDLNLDNYDNYISNVVTNEYIELALKNPIPKKNSAYIERIAKIHDIKILIKEDKIVTTLDDLKKLIENLYPEKNNTLDLTASYLLPEKIDLLAEYYLVAKNILNHSILKDLITPLLNNGQQFNYHNTQMMTEIYDYLENKCNMKGNSNFIAHIKKIIYFHLEKEIISSYDEKEKKQYISYFNLSVTLDRIAIYSKAHFIAQLHQQLYNKLSYHSLIGDMALTKIEEILKSFTQLVDAINHKMKKISSYETLVSLSKEFKDELLFFIEESIKLHQILKYMINDTNLELAVNLKKELNELLFVSRMPQKKLMSHSVLFSAHSKEQDRKSELESILPNEEDTALSTSLSY